MKRIYPLILLLAACGKPGMVPASAPAQAVNATPVKFLDSEGKLASETRETVGPDFDDLIAAAPSANQVATPVPAVLPTTKVRGYQLPQFENTWGLSRDVFDKAVRAMADGGKFSNQRYVALIDMGRHSNSRRFFLFDLHSGKVERHNVAHGTGSDPKATGFAKLFANKPDSEKTSLGIYRTAGVYKGKHGQQLRLQGLEPSNNEALDRGIVLHGASYVQDGQRAGRSWGCPAVDQHVVSSVINRMKGGALLLIWK
jgi:hypothetical protein